MSTFSTLIRSGHSLALEWETVVCHSLHPETSMPSDQAVGCYSDGSGDTKRGKHRRQTETREEACGKREEIQGGHRPTGERFGGEWRRDGRGGFLMRETRWAGRQREQMRQWKSGRDWHVHVSCRKVGHVQVTLLIAFSKGVLWQEIWILCKRRLICHEMHVRVDSQLDSVQTLWCWWQDQEECLWTEF